jgi:hypothetical protein
MGKVSPPSRTLILKLTEMGYGVRKIYNKCRQPNWTYSGVQKTVEKIKKTGTIDRIEGRMVGKRKSKLVGQLSQVWFI